MAGVASFLATVLAAWNLADPLPLLDIAGLRWGGSFLATSGIVLVLAAQSNMGASWRVGVDQAEVTDLVTSGLYSVTRNPIFLGMLSFWLGMALLLPNAVSISSFAIALFAIEVQVRLVEEPYLLRTHGANYLAYASRTGRLLPRLGRLRQDAGRA